MLDSDAVCAAVTLCRFCAEAVVAKIKSANVKAIIDPPKAADPIERHMVQNRLRSKVETLRNILPGCLFRKIPYVSENVMKRRPQKMPTAYLKSPLLLIVSSAIRRVNNHIVAAERKCRFYSTILQ